MTEGMGGDSGMVAPPPSCLAAPGESKVVAVILLGETLVVPPGDMISAILAMLMGLVGDWKLAGARERTGLVWVPAEAIDMGLEAVKTKTGLVGVETC